MKLRTQLIGAIVAFFILLVFLSGFVISTNQQVESLSRQQAVANSIAIETGELGYLSNDYILHREPQLVDRWNAKYESIAGNIARLSVDQPEQRAIAGSLAADLRNMKSVFDEIRSDPLPAESAETGFIELSWSRLAVLNQGMIFDASRLAGLIRDQETGVRVMRLYFTLALMGAFGALLLAGYFFVYRRILRSLGDIQQGAAAVGSGNFNQSLDESSDDELGELSRSFNRMTADLRGVTASKADLEREMSGRKMAEQHLILKNEDLNALNEELTATQEELRQNVDELVLAEKTLRESEEKFRVLFTQMVEGSALHEIVYCASGEPVDYRILDINPSFERILGLKREDVVGKTSKELYGVDTPPYFEQYRRVAETGQPEEFDVFFAPMNKHFTISAYSPELGKFATIFVDITERKRAKAELEMKNEDLNALNEELTSTGEELHQNLEELSRRELELNKALAEKEVLLSEIHHRVKNNLTAFISLLSLEGSTEDSPAGKALKQDLQNRARSMALVHETLYRTNLFNEVDMGIYLTTLIDQVANSFRMIRPVRTVVEASSVMLDVSRATPAGLVVNELITNSFKYAFPADFNSCEPGAEVPCTISVSFTQVDGLYILRVADNGVGLPRDSTLQRQRRSDSSLSTSLQSTR